MGTRWSSLIGALATVLTCLSVGTAAADGEPVSRAPSPAGDAAHAAVFDEAVFPSAQACGVCHAEHYREWSVSPHAYAQISPTFNAYHATLGVLTNGTLGDFCQRCHSQVGMTAGEPVITSNANRSDVAREGVTCVVCHRVSGAYGKITGRLPLEAGDIESAIYGPRPDDELRRVLTSPNEFEGFSPENGARRRKIHRQARVLEQLSRPSFCGRCHDVRLPNGFRLEDAFSEYKQTEAAKNGEPCQACHMGPIPGVPSEYPLAPAAVVGGRATRPARRTNHMFVGPDDPLVHPGIFPHDAEAAEYVTPLEWVSFDYEAGWGSEAFEAREPSAAEFPELWADPEERSYAREIIDRQLALRAEAHERGTTLLRNGYGLGEIRILDAEDGLEFEVEVRNKTHGHSVPTGLIAERNVFLQVSVRDAGGTLIFRSGDLDPNGDLRDPHSRYVHAGVIPRDSQLFNLRSPFVIRLAHGGEREQVLPANYSLDPLVFIRPSTTPSLLFGGVRSARLQKQSIEALGHRWAHYSVDPGKLTGNAPYTVRIALVAGQLPPHLIHAISGVGFEYGLTARQLARAIVSGYRVLWERSVVLDATLAPKAIPAAERAADVAGADRERTVVPEGRGALDIFEQEVLEIEAGHLQLSDDLTPYPAATAERPRPLLEIGDRFLGRGPIRRGIRTPARQMLQPWFLLFGEARSALQSYADGDSTVSEWANRIDLDAVLNLSGTERLVAGLRPVDRDSGEFSGYSFGPGGDRGWKQELSADVTRLFFEGDFGQIFPGLDPADRRALDYGFSVGRQPLAVQDGVLVSDIVDAIGVTRNSLTLKGVPNLRLTGIIAWNDVNRADHVDQGSARLFALLSQADTAWDSSVSADLLFVHDRDGDTSGWFLGVSTTQRLGPVNTAFRIAGSIPLHGNSPEVGGGGLLMAELSRTLPGSDNVVYLNGFWSIGEFSSAARGPDQGLPVSGLGILWGPVGMGRYGVPLGQPIDDTVGGALGFQMFHLGIRGQLTLEVGARVDTARGDEGALGIGFLYQRAFGRHWILRADASGAVQNGNGPSYGTRLEWLFRF